MLTLHLASYMRSLPIVMGPVRFSSCPWCGSSSGHFLYKSGPFTCKNGPSLYKSGPLLCKSVPVLCKNWRCGSCLCKSGPPLLEDRVGGLHAGHEVVVYVTVQQPLTRHGGVHPHSLEDAGEELDDVSVVATVLEFNNVVAVEVHGVDVDHSAQGHEVPVCHTVQRYRHRGVVAVDVAVYGCRKTKESLGCWSCI